MKINLATGAFDPSILSRLEEDHGAHSNVMHGGKWIRLPCFGTVLIGMDKLVDCRWAMDIEKTLELDERSCSGTLFVCPEDWRMPQLLKAMGVFKSTNDARKNGWDKNIDEGLDFHIVRINKVRGIIWTYKAPHAKLNVAGSWEATSLEGDDDL